MEMPITLIFPVLRYVARRDHHGRRGQPAIKAGQELWVIKLDCGFLRYSYVSENDALEISRRLIADDEEVRRTPSHPRKHWQEFNVVADPEDAHHVWHLPGSRTVRRK